MTAAPPVVEQPAQVLEFALGEQRYCVGIDAVDEIVSPDAITDLPDTPPQVEGVMDLRGETTTIVDPKVVFGRPATDDDSHVVVFDGDSDRDRRLGWLVDRVHRVTGLPDVEVDPVADNEYLNGVVNADPFVLWVDTDRVNASVSL